MTRRKKIIIGISILIIIGFFRSIYESKNPQLIKEKEIKKNKENCNTAQVMVKHFVKQKLAAPLTAEFSKLYCRYENGGYFIQGKVVSKNLYGVPLENTFQARMVFTGGNEYANSNWTMEKFYFLD